MHKLVYIANVRLPTEKAHVRIRFVKKRFGRDTVCSWHTRWLALTSHLTDENGFPQVLNRSRERGPVSLRSNVGTCLPEGSALHCESEYNRRTGCGKTARPSLYRRG